jgi:hypothetical protein
VKPKGHRSEIVVAGRSERSITEPLQRAADRNGHGPQTAGSGIGAMLGAMIGSFGGPLGAVFGASLGAWIGYEVCD